MLHIVDCATQSCTSSFTYLLNHQLGWFSRLSFYIFVKTKHGCTKTIKTNNIAVAPCARYESAGVFGRVLFVALLSSLSIYEAVLFFVYRCYSMENKLDFVGQHIRNFLIKIKSDVGNSSMRAVGIWWSRLWQKNRQHVTGRW